MSGTLTFVPLHGHVIYDIVITIYFIQHPVKQNHCLHHLLPVAKSISYALRQVGHGLSLEHVLSVHLLIG